MLCSSGYFDNLDVEADADWYHKISKVIKAEDLPTWQWLMLWSVNDENDDAFDADAASRYKDESDLSPFFADYNLDADANADADAASRELSRMTLDLAAKAIHPQ